MLRVNRVAQEWYDGTTATTSGHWGFQNNKKFEWVNDGTGDITFFMDRHIPYILSDVTAKPKYAWLCESRTIIPEVFEYVEDNAEMLLNFCNGIITCDDELAKRDGFMHTLTNAVPWVEDRRIHEKTKLVSMISSNKSWAQGHRDRLRYVDKFRDKVDFYGRGFNDIEKKEDGLKDYMFSIAIENCKYNTYFTEKVTDCFAVGTIPIFYGAETISKHFNPDGIIFLTDDFDVDSLTEELYYSKMNAIEENLEKAMNFITSEDYIAETYFGM